MTDPLLSLRLEHFSPLVGADIGIDFGAGQVPGRVLSAERIGGHTTREGGGFSVMLRAPQPGPPAQGSYALSHPQLGEIAVFMTPRRFEEGQTVYEMVFN